MYLSDNPIGSEVILYDLYSMSRPKLVMYRISYSETAKKTVKQAVYAISLVMTKYERQAVLYLDFIFTM